MFGDRLRHAVKDTFQIMDFACVLDFDNDDLAFAVERLDVNAIELIVSAFLIALAFEDFHDFDLFTQHNSQETVEHVKVSLLAQQTLDSPIEPNIPVL